MTAAATAVEPLPAPRTLRLLVVEDSQLDYELLLATLAREPFDVAARRVEERAELIDALAQQPWDVVISDHHLPRFSSTEALAVVRASGLDLPFIIVSGLIGEDTAVAAMRSGADDYLMKGRLARLGQALLNALAAAEARHERLEATRSLAQSQQQLRELLAHLDTVVEEERAAIAREIHDDVGGLLTALRFDLSWIERNGDPRSAERARHARHTLTQAMQAAQRIQHDLHPPVLDEGLVAALHWQVEEFRRRTSIPIEFSSNVERLALDTTAAMTVYRTLQEALTNVSKHARATALRVGLVAGDGQLSLEIADNGVGLRAGDLKKPSSFGLRGLAERAARAGGWIDVSPGQRGTCVLLSLPIRDTADSPGEQRR